jgi:hypothetical protein
LIRGMASVISEQKKMRMKHYRSSLHFSFVRISPCFIFLIYHIFYIFILLYFPILDNFVVNMSAYHRGDLEFLFYQIMILYFSAEECYNGAMKTTLTNDLVSLQQEDDRYWDILHKGTKVGNISLEGHINKLVNSVATVLVHVQ